MTHTPGPWKANSHGGWKPGTGWMIVKEQEPNLIYISEILGETKEAEANARLIAAAPQLLNCLQDALKTMENVLEINHANRTQPEPRIVRYRTAIADATAVKDTKVKLAEGEPPEASASPYGWETKAEGEEA